MNSIQENNHNLFVFLNKTMQVLTEFVKLNQNHPSYECRELCQTGMQLQIEYANFVDSDFASTITRPIQASDSYGMIFTCLSEIHPKIERSEPVVDPKKEKEEMEVPMVNSINQINIGPAIQGFPIKIETVMKLEEIEKAKIVFQRLLIQEPLDMLHKFRTVKAELAEAISSTTESYPNDPINTEGIIESTFIDSTEIPNRMEKYLIILIITCFDKQ